MRYGKVILLILIVLLFSGCLEEITGRFMKVDVVYVNLSVVMQDNKTVIQDVDARMGEVPKIVAPGIVLPGKFPAIYVDIKQLYNISRPGTLKDISLQNGQDYNGTGNYSFIVQLFKNAHNKTQPVYIYSDITDNQSKRLARHMIVINLTDQNQVETYK